MRRDTLWWLLVAVILLPVSAAVVEPNVVEPNVADPNAAGVPADAGPPWVVVLGSIVGLVYAAVRVFVMMTPTPLPGAILTPPQQLAAVLAKALGLDPKQGVQAKQK